MIRQLLQKRIAVLSAVLMLGGLSMPAQPVTYSLTLQNASPYRVLHIHIAAPDDLFWSGDRLGNWSLSPGYAVTIPDLRPGEYDIRLETKDSACTFRVRVFGNVWRTFGSDGIVCVLN
jgi:hypothetical protein